MTVKIKPLCRKHSYYAPVGKLNMQFNCSGSCLGVTTINICWRGDSSYLSTLGYYHPSGVPDWNGDHCMWEHSAPDAAMYWENYYNYTDLTRPSDYRICDETDGSNDSYLLQQLPNK